MNAQRNLILAYALALVLPLGALLARVALVDSSGDQNWAMLFIIPVTLCAYMGGARPGLLCTVFSMLLVEIFSGDLQRAGGAQLSMSLIKWITFIFAGCVISYLAETLHRAQERLRTDESHLAGILGSAMDGIVTVDQNLKIQYLNTAAEKMFGRPSAELLGKSGRQLVPAADRELCEQLLASVSADGLLQRYAQSPIHGVRADGSQFPAEISASKHDVASDKHFTLVIRDVSEREAVQTALREREALYRGLFESLEEGVVVWNAEGKIEACNPAFEHILGWKAQDIVGLHYTQIPWQSRTPGQTYFNPESLAAAIVLRTGQPILQRERLATRADGGEVWLLQNGIPLHTEGGKAARRIVVTISDITDRRRHVEALSQMADIVANSGDAIISKSPDGFIRTWNPGAEKMLGYSAQEALGQTFYNLLLHSDQHATERALRERICGGQSAETFDITLLRKDGNPIEALVTASPLHDASDAVLGISLIARDVTDRKRAEEALRERDAAEEASRLKSEFLATMSHELRTPLTGIIGFTEYLRAQQAGALNDEQAESLDHILNSSQHLLDLINGILDLSRIEAGKMDLTPELFPVREVLEEVCGVISPLSHKKNIVVKQQVAIELSDVTLDRGKFKQVLYNLLSNAVKFTDNGGDVTVALDLLQSERLQLRVTDTGIGIDPKDVDKLFQNFHQLDNGNTRRHEGTGLGLALTKKIVELQHGVITVESAPGRGSVFSVTLPLAAT